MKGQHSIKQRRVLGGVAALVAIALGLNACGAPTVTEMAGANQSQSTMVPAGSSAEMPHIHGLGFSAHGSQLLVPAHDGFRIFADGEWHMPALPVHDYKDE